MTLEQLRVFVAVAERLHMTRAAEALNLTQSAASASVAALEARYGVNLFDRVGRGLALSDAGKAFLPEAQAVLARAVAAEQALDDVAGLRRGVVTLYASQTLANYWLPPRMAKFANVRPGVELRLTVGNTAQVAKAVKDGTAELGFIEGRVNDPSLLRRSLGSDRLAIVASAGHPLRGSADVCMGELMSAEWVLREPGSGTRSELEAVLEQKGMGPGALQVRMELPSNEAILAAVASGQCLSAISELAAGPWIAAGTISALAFDLPKRPFELLSQSQRRQSVAAAAFLASLGT